MTSDYKDLHLIIFDFDGTLGDTRANIVLTMRQTLERLGYAQPDEDTIAATIGVPLEKGFEQMLPGISPDDVALCARTYREIFETNRKVLVPKLFPHVKETLEALKKAGLVLTVASSRSSKSLNEFLREMDIAPYISYVLGADNVTHAKPHPEPVLKTMAEMGFRAEETLVVGDMPVDILMGKGAGARTCAVTYGNATREELAAAGADVIIDDLNSFPVVS
jgi:phosphoglycolate phosphatase